MMTRVKNLLTTFYSRIDHVVKRIENHDAVIDAAIKNSRRALAQAKVRLARVRADGEKLQTQLKTVTIAAQKWKQRARDIAAKDEATALACVSRHRQCKQQMRELETAVLQHQQVEERLISNIAKLEQQVNTVSRQCNLMRARESTAQAMYGAQNMVGTSRCDIDDLLERWETSISESEIAAGQFDVIDPLEKKFLDEQEQKDLYAELQVILAEEEAQS